jgi:hypothetical protein
MADKPTITIADLTRLREQDSRPAPLTRDEVEDYSTAALVVLRGLSRADKLRVIRRMRRVLG